MKGDFGQKILEALAHIRTKTEFTPRVGVILGSGLSEIAENFGGQSLSYESIPHFLKTGVQGHAGKLFVSERVAIMAGRYHYYEGHGFDTLLLPVGVLCALGCSHIILTNASGSINADLPVGSLVAISDHINFMGSNPLIGPHDPSFGQRFPDMSDVYSKELRALVQKIEPSMKSGVYLAVTGPSYETPAEIRAFRTLGADLVGMSTVPEAIFANAQGKKVMGISLVTNLAAGLGPSLSHEEVMKEGQQARQKLEHILEAVVDTIVK